jgi:hypothetical protein
LFGKANQKSYFYIGPIVKGNDRQVVIQDYNAEGNWGKEWVLEYKEILRIGFFDRYSKHFNKFMKNKSHKLVAS